MLSPPSRPGRLLSCGAVLAAGTLLLVTSACGSGSSAPYTDRGALETYLRQAPGVPLVLPTTLSEQYEFLGPGFEQSRDGRMVVRTMEFRSEDVDSSLVVDVCTAEAGSRVDVCVPPGAETTAIGRTVGGTPVWIRALGSGALPVAARDFWTDVRLTSDLDSVDWLT